MPEPVGKSTPVGRDNPNRDWWESHPMTYDWEKTLRIEPYSQEWYDEIDRRFFESAYYAQDKGHAPFSRFIPESAIRGMRVLEIGCGMGSHAELLTRRGANLTAIDQTSFAVRATMERMKIRRLPIDVRELDAERLPLPENEFDLVWAWGVIHHSRSTETIIKNVARVLKPSGSFRFMVYYRPCLVYWFHCALLRGVFAGQLLKKSLNQIYVDSADGFFARTFTKGELDVLLDPCFRDMKYTVLGLKAELFPIPRGRFKVAIERATPDWLAQSVLSRWGSMIFVQAKRGSRNSY
jgi:SAM-dependent methyltransferase